MGSIMNRIIGKLILILLISSGLMAQGESKDLSNVLHFDGIAKNGINEAITIPYSSKMNFDYSKNGCSMAVTCWVKTAKNSTHPGRIFDRCKLNKSGGGYYLQLKANGTLYCFWNGFQKFKLTSKQKVNDGLWHHIAIVKEGKSLKLYIDGSLVKSITKDDNPVDSIHGLSNNKPFMIGQSQTEHNLFVGSMKDFRLYQWKVGAPKNIITDADILAIKNDINRSYTIANTELILEVRKTTKKLETPKSKEIGTFATEGTIRGAVKNTIQIEHISTKNTKIRWYDKDGFFSILECKPTEAYIIVKLTLKPGYSLSKYDYSFHGKSEVYPCLSVSSGRGFGVNLTTFKASKTNQPVKMLYKVKQGDVEGELVFNLNSTLKFPTVTIKEEPKKD